MATTIKEFDVKGEWPGSFTLIDKGFSALKRNKSFVIFYVALLTALTAAVWVIDPSVVSTFQLPSAEGSKNVDPAASTLSGLSGIVALLLLGASYYYGLLAARQQEKPVTEIVLAGIKKVFHIIAATILAVPLVLIGLILLIVPGIYIALRLSFAYYLILDKNLGPIQALKESWRISKGKVGKVLGYIGLTIVLMIPASVLASFMPVLGDLVTNTFTLALAVVGAWLYYWADAHSDTSEA